MQLNTRKKSMKLTVREGKQLEDACELLRSIAAGAEVLRIGGLAEQADNAREFLLDTIKLVSKNDEEFEQKENPDGDTQSNRSVDKADAVHGTNSGTGKAK